MREPAARRPLGSPGMDAPSARAASLASSAALPRPPCDAAHPAQSRASPYGNPYAVPYAYPYGNRYARGVRTPSPAGRRITGGHAPEGGQSAAKPAADWPPSGEWSAPAARCASRD